MLKKFNQYFKELICDRTEEISEKLLFNNKRYRELSTQIIEFQKAITENLPPQLQSLVFKYDEAEAEQDGITMTAMYRQGFMDGVKSTRLIKRYGAIQSAFQGEDRRTPD